MLHYRHAIRPTFFCKYIEFSFPSRDGNEKRRTTYPIYLYVYVLVYHHVRVRHYNITMFSLFSKYTIKLLSLHYDFVLISALSAFLNLLMICNLFGNEFVSLQYLLFIGVELWQCDKR